MKKGAALLLAPLLFLLLFTDHHSEAAEVDPSALASTEANNSSNVSSNGVNLAPPDSNLDKDEHGASKGGGKREKEGGGGDSERRTVDGKDKTLEEPKPEDGNNKNGDLVGGAVHEEVCDPSNRCTDENNKFVACLRVPGKDSLDLSLLIQNKGTGSLDVNLMAPNFVNLDQGTVQLQAKENKEVKVSVGDGANDNGTNNTVIVLRAGDGNCSINFGNMISASVRKSEPSSSSMILSTRSLFIFILLAAAVLVAAAWSCIRFRRTDNQDARPRYQGVEIGLPVSSGGKKEADEADRWDNSWGEIWDDEEAPMTPSKLVPNPSLKGLASRRSNKDGWKD